MRKVLGALVALSGLALAQNAALTPNPQFYATDNNGFPLAGGKVCSYAAGTTTPLSTYTDSTAGTANSNPVILNAAGRANIWLSNVAYKLVLLTAGTDNTCNTGSTLWTVDGILSGGFVNSGPWTVTGTNLNNTAFGKVCVSSSSCTPLAQFDVSGASGGTNLIRIDDTGNNPGIDFYGSGSKFGTLYGTSSGMNIGGSDGMSQISIAPGAVTFKNNSTGGATNISVIPGSSQSTTDFLTFKNATNTAQAGVNSTWQAYFPLFNSTCTGSAIAYQTTGTNFSVDCLGDISSTAQINLAAAGGVTATATNLFKVGGTTVVDNNRNGFFNNITIAGTCSGAGCGGGGGGGYPVLDTVFTVANAADSTKKMVLALGGITTATTRTLTVPNNNGTIATLENNQTISGTYTFSAIPTFTLGASGLVFNSTATGSTTAFQLNNNNMFIDGNGNLTLACASGCTAGSTGADLIANGYITAGTWVGLHSTTSAPATTPGSGFSAIGYDQTVTSGLGIWLYDRIHSAWTGIDLGGVGGTGITSLNGQTGSSQTIAGTANEVIATTTTNTVTLTTPQAIGTTSNVTFDSVTTGAGSFVFQSGQTACATAAFQTTNSNFIVDGCGNLTLAGSGSVINIGGSAGGVNVTADIAATSIQTTGGIDVCNTNSCTSGLAIEVNNSKLVDNARNGFFNNMTVTGTCTGCVGSGITGINSQTGPSITLAGTTNQVTVANTTNTVTFGLPQNIHTGASPTFTGLTLSGISGLTQCVHVNSSGLFSGTGTDCAGGGGVTGAIGTANRVLANGTSGSTQTGNVTFSLPQDIGTASNVNFGTITPSGVVNSTVGAGVAFQAGGGAFAAFANGNINGANINAATSLQINGTTVVNSAGGGRFVGMTIAGTNTTLDTAGNITAGGGFFVNSGSTFTGQGTGATPWNVTFTSPFSINGSGSFTQLVFVGGLLVSAR
jgi:hypothetical protein